MQAIILAAGRSTRTFPLTETRPKPLLPLWGLPLMEHQLRQLQGLVDESILVVGYRAEQIEAHFGESLAGMRLRYARQSRQRGTADAVAAASPYVNGTALVLNGDDFYHREDLEGLAALGRGIVVARAPDPQNRAVVTLDGDRVTDIVEKPASPPPDAWCSVGGYCLQREDLTHLADVVESPRGELELPDLILDLARSAKPPGVRVHHIAKFWLPLTYAWDLLGATQFLWSRPERAGELGLVDVGRQDFGPDVSVTGPLWLGQGARLEKGCRIVGPVAIGSGCRLMGGVEMSRSVLLDDVTVGENAVVRDSVLGAGTRIGAGAQLLSAAASGLRLEVQGKLVAPDLDLLGTVAGDGAVITERENVPPGTIRTVARS